MTSQNCARNLAEAGRLVCAGIVVPMVLPCSFKCRFTF